MFEGQGGALGRDQGQDCGDNFALHLDGSRRRRHCPVRIEIKFSPGAFFRRLSAPSSAPPNPNKGMFQMTANVAVTGAAGQELTQFVERVERLEEEKKAISGDIREVYAEMKGCGFDARAVREIVKIRKQDHSERKEMEAILALYMAVLNMT
jgi:uncharacterized protein (UPF0335 family)